MNHIPTFENFLNEGMTKIKGINFDSTPYISSHGKSPRGYGQWAFSTDRKGSDPMFSNSMDYAKAKEWAADQIKGKGISTLYVLG
jgi:hypothetical protein